MTNKTMSALALLFCLLPSTVSFGQARKWFQVEGAVNISPSFLIGINVDHKDQVYREGDALKITVTAEQDCYLYLIYESQGAQTVLFPNKYEKDNFLRAKESIQIPRNNTYNIVCRPPFGQETLWAYATKEPDVALFKDKDFHLEQHTPVDQSDLRGMISVLQTQASEDWAETSLSITTKPRNSLSKQSKKMALCVGISEYASNSIPDLMSAHLDAELIAQALKTHCGIEDVTLLQNEQATRQNVMKAMQRLAQKSESGDTVYFFFSGHGGRMADTNGDEEDGLDEYLVPHDGQTGNPQTLLLDDQFAHNVQSFKACKMVIMMDCSYSGGISKSAKGLRTSLLRPQGQGQVDFFDGDIRRTKDLGQNNTIIVAACRADQNAWEMGQGKESVLTHFLSASLAAPNADANGDGKLSVKEAFEYAESPIRSFVQQEFGETQTPVLIDNANDSIYFRE